jgi:hypothetical protein
MCKFMIIIVRRRFLGTNRKAARGVRKDAGLRLLCLRRRKRMMKLKTRDSKTLERGILIGHEKTFCLKGPESLTTK